MKNEEAKFILGAYRPDGGDAGDGLFAEPLAQAERDPQLRAWFESQRRFDGALAAKLQQMAPPPGLREAILAGGRVSVNATTGRAWAPRQTPRARRWWTNPVWMGMAAVVAVGVFFGGRSISSATRPTAADLPVLALRDLAEAHDNHVGDPRALAAVKRSLAQSALPLAGNVQLDFAELRKQNCRSITLAGREVFEVCFQRDGAWYHVYVGRRAQFAPGALDPGALMTVRGEFVATTWADGENVYTLVTRGAAEALRRLI